jgi:hypothetical protein
MVTVVPASLWPPARRLPALAMVAARAFGTPVARLPALGLGWALPFATVWLAALTVYARRGRVAAVDRHGLLLFEERGVSPRDRFGLVDLGVLAASAAGGFLVLV